MRVFIDSNVHASIQEFYDAAMMRLAYEICEDDNGEDYVWVRDAVHSMLYY